MKRASIYKYTVAGYKILIISKDEEKKKNNADTRVEHDITYPRHNLVFPPITSPPNL